MNLHSYLSELQKISDSAEDYIQMIKEKMEQAQPDTLLKDHSDAENSNESILARRFSKREVSLMLGVSESGLYKAEKEHRIPRAHYYKNAVGSEIRDGWSMDQLLLIRKAFNALPNLPKPHQAMVLSFPNLKGGCWKTTLTLLAAQHYAIKGYRILLVDTDAQGTLSFFMGYRPDIDTTYEDTIAPFLLCDESNDETNPDKFESLDYAIRPTKWPNIDIIPANLSLSLIDMSLPIALASAENPDAKQLIVERLGMGIGSVADQYDLILIDGTPSLSILTLSTLMACNHVIVPCPSQMADYASTVQFFTNLKNSVSSFVKAGMEVTFPQYHVLVTKYANAKYSNWMTKIIRKTFGLRALESVVKKSDEIGKAGTQISTIYEKQPSKSANRRSLMSAIDIYDEVFTEIEKKIIQPYFQSDNAENFADTDNELDLIDEGVM